METKNGAPIGIEIELKRPDDFLILKETLSRIGIQSKTSKTLYQSVHILHKQGKYALVHFKELFRMDGKQADITDDDYRRRNSIAKMAASWGLCNIINKKDIEFLIEPGDTIKIVPFKEKNDWSLIQKYTIGKRSEK